MIFNCYGCSQEKDFFKDFSILIIPYWDKNGPLYRYCKDCRKSRASLPDVFWDGKPEENLADDPTTGQPRVFLSRGQKAAYLKEKGLVECGDKVHGSPIEFSKQQVSKKDSRHEVKMALKHVREMGKDVRRQEYLKILKNGYSQTATRIKN